MKIINKKNGAFIYKGNPQDQAPPLNCHFQHCKLTVFRGGVRFDEFAQDCPPPKTHRNAVNLT